MDSWAQQIKDAGAQPTGAVIRNAATVALLRDGAEGLEVLMGKRSSTMEFHGGAWVFPGGRIDDADWEHANDVAAAREAHEEAGVRVDTEQLVHISHWLTPAISPKRFATWFFVGPAGDDHESARADGVESDAVRWMTPTLALSERDAGVIQLAPPQYVTVSLLTRFDTVAHAMAALTVEPPIDFQPEMHFFEGGGAMTIYTGDVAHGDVSLLESAGPRHRLSMHRDGWLYERDPE